MVIPGVMKLVTLADVCELIERHLPAHFRRLRPGCVGVACLAKSVSDVLMWD
jgi:hypothetical protein